jgi:Protein of unknown function (DUF3887)
MRRVLQASCWNLWLSAGLGLALWVLLVKAVWRLRELLARNHGSTADTDGLIARQRSAACARQDHLQGPCVNAIFTLSVNLVFTAQLHAQGGVPIMATDGEREVMGLALTTNAEMVAAVLRGAEDPATQSVMAAIAATRTLGVLVDDTLHALVRRARREGRTWAEIGQVLNVTRQGAFQRFGGGQTPDAGDEPLKPIPGARDKATSVIEHLLASRWEDLWATFDSRVTKAATVEMFETTLAKSRKEYGEVVSLGTPRSSVVGDYTVVDVPITCERGDGIGRVSFDADEKVAGLFLLPADTP